MPFTIELVNPDGQRFTVAPHRRSWHWPVTPENTSSETILEMSNADDVWLYTGLDGPASNASAVAEQVREIGAAEHREIASLLEAWAAQAPEGSWISG